MKQKVVGVGILILIVSCSPKHELVKLSTEKGDMYIHLYDDTPKHKENFFKLVEEDFYDGTTFHRVIKEFMIQGGDPYSKDSTKSHLAGTGGPGYTIEAEFRENHFHKKGVLSAARQGDQVNPERRSSGSQFYIVQGKTFTADELDRAEARISGMLKEEFTLTEEAKKAYQTVGGSPWLDMQYTVFGEVVIGLEVIDKIAAVETNRADRPMQDIDMTMERVKLSEKRLFELGIDSTALNLIAE